MNVEYLGNKELLKLKNCRLDCLCRIFFEKMLNYTQPRITN